MKQFAQDPVLVLLIVVTLIFSIMLIIVEKLFPNDGQVFQVFSQLAAGFGGAVLARVKPQSKDDGLETKSQVKITESAVPTAGSKDNG